MFRQGSYASCPCGTSENQEEAMPLESAYHLPKSFSRRPKTLCRDAAGKKEDRQLSRAAGAFARANQAGVDANQRELLFPQRGTSLKTEKREVCLKKALWHEGLCSRFWRACFHRNLEETVPFSGLDRISCPKDGIKPFKLW